MIRKVKLCAPVGLPWTNETVSVVEAVRGVSLELTDSGFVRIFKVSCPEWVIARYDWYVVVQDEPKLEPKPVPNALKILDKGKKK